jgi:hypothetical protein
LCDDVQPAIDAAATNSTPSRHDRVTSRFADRWSRAGSPP